MNDASWPKKDKQIAPRAFDKAREREYASLMQQTRAMAEAITTPEELWRLHDFLTDRRDEVDANYDYRYSQLIHVFARLMRDRWLQADDLAGLREEKLARIERIATVDL
jgi:hypothetical protein